MMYPFLTLNDDTEITHSEMKPDGQVKVLMVFIMRSVIFRDTPGQR